MAEGPRGQTNVPPTLLTVNRAERDGAVIVSLVGELDMTTVDQATIALTEATAQHPAVVIDMTELRFFSSAGLNMLLQLRKDLEGRPVDVRLAGDQRAVILPMELTGLKNLFPIHGSVDDALAAMGG